MVRALEQGTAEQVSCAGPEAELPRERELGIDTQIAPCREPHRRRNTVQVAISPSCKGAVAVNAGENPVFPVISETEVPEERAVLEAEPFILDMVGGAVAYVSVHEHGFGVKFQAEVSMEYVPVLIDESFVCERGHMPST